MVEVVSGRGISYGTSRRPSRSRVLWGVVTCEFVKGEGTGCLVGRPGGVPEASRADGPVTGDVGWTITPLSGRGGSTRGRRVRLHGTPFRCVVEGLGVSHGTPW